MCFLLLREMLKEEGKEMGDFPSLCLTAHCRVLVQWYLPFVYYPVVLGLRGWLAPARPFLYFVASSPLWFDASLITQLICCVLFLLWGFSCLPAALPSVGKSRNSLQHSHVPVVELILAFPASGAIRAGGGEGCVYQTCYILLFPAGRVLLEHVSHALNSFSWRSWAACFKSIMLK